tara:strand:+ start:17646 stop:19124 length:1479 start_codon:yes stop_codon:yes gene_type:complete
MKSFREHSQTGKTLVFSRKPLVEASILKPDYVIGHKFLYKGGIKEMDNEGFKHGDIFTAVKPIKNAIFIGDEEGENEKWLQSGKKVFHIKGALGYKSAYFNHVKESGGYPSGAQWEELIIFEYNKLNNKKNDKDITRTAESFPLHLDMAKVIAQNFNKKLKDNELVSTGKGGIPNKISSLYKESGASNTTPKTDIAGVSFKEKISLKKEGGSQLMSGAKGESIATVRAALSKMGENKNFANGLISEMETKMSSLLTTETVTSLNKRTKDGESDEATLDFQQKDKDNKELSAILESYINNNTKVNELFSQNIVLEASTGNVKFSEGKAAANLLGKFDAKTGAVVIEPITSINDSIIKKYASSVKPYVAFKKGGGNSPAYSAMRMSLKEDFGIDSISTILINELKTMDGYETLLTEDYLDENFLSQLKKAGNWAKELGSKTWNKFQQVIKKVLDNIKKALSKIAKMGKRMFEAVMSFFNVEISLTRGIVTEVTL